MKIILFLNTNESVAITLGPLGPTIPGAPCSPVVP